MQRLNFGPLVLVTRPMGAFQSYHALIERRKHKAHIWEELLNRGCKPDLVELVDLVNKHRPSKARWEPLEEAKAAFEQWGKVAATKMPGIPRPKARLGLPVHYPADRDMQTCLYLRGVTYLPAYDQPGLFAVPGQSFILTGRQLTPKADPATRKAGAKVPERLFTQEYVAESTLRAAGAQEVTRMLWLRGLGSYRQLERRS